MVLRLFAMMSLIVLPFWGERWLVVFGQAVSPPTDPWSIVTQIGIGGAIAAVLFLWQRDTAKQRDKAVEQLGEFSKIIAEMKSAVTQSTAAHEASTKAMNAMTEVLKERPPTRVLVNRLTDAVASLEQMSRGEGK